MTANAGETANAVAIADAGIASEVEVIASTCRNRCDYGPSMNVYPGPTFYNELTGEAIEEIYSRDLCSIAFVECNRRAADEVMETAEILGAGVAKALLAQMT